MNTTNSSKLLLISTLIIVILLSLCIVGKFEKEDEIIMNQDYCDSVMDWKLSNGKEGHPDYDKTYKYCK
jgi:hypothetical protein